MIVRRLKNDELYHFGIKGQKWGVRRYQNPDGSLTDAGKKRYGVKTDFNSAYNHIQYSGKIRNQYNNATLASALSGLSLMAASLPIMSVSLPVATASAFVGAGASIATGVLQGIKNRKIEDSKNSLVGIQRDLHDISNYTSNRFYNTNDLSKKIAYYKAGNTAINISSQLQENNVDPRKSKALYDEKSSTIKIVDREKYKKQIQKHNRRT